MKPYLLGFNLVQRLGTDCGTQVLCRGGDLIWCASFRGKGGECGLCTNVGPETTPHCVPGE